MANLMSNLWPSINSTVGHWLHQKLLASQFTATSEDSESDKKNNWRVHRFRSWWRRRRLLSSWTVWHSLNTTALKLLWNCSVKKAENARKLLENCSKIIWKLHWKCSKNAQKLLWKRSETALKLPFIQAVAVLIFGKMATLCQHHWSGANSNV